MVDLITTQQTNVYQTFPLKCGFKLCETPCVNSVILKPQFDSNCITDQRENKNHVKKYYSYFHIFCLEFWHIFILSVNNNKIQ